MLYKEDRNVRNTGRSAGETIDKPKVGPDYSDVTEADLDMLKMSECAKLICAYYRLKDSSKKSLKSAKERGYMQLLNEELGTASGCYMKVAIVPEDRQHEEY